VIYYVHPAAPPWYVINHGFEADFTTPGSCAGLARFDALTHVPFYHAFYDKNANVFAAMPSLHAAYMFIATLYAMRYRANRWVLLIFWLITLGTWFAAVYSAHHYIVDVIAGIIVSLVGIALFEWLNRRYKLYVSP
ncbi:MAG: phosphatase PAP2 family protein, partial [Bacteroidales bacterium]|nr:phosphatase PAP2 family protein [Bacteroidales bacterium]